MNSQEYDPWDAVDLSPQDSIDIYKQNDSKDAWDQLDFDEGFWKSAFRTVSQIPQGIASTTPPGLLAGLWELLATGDVYDPEEIENLRMISEREGIPFDEEAYYTAAQSALSGIPTVSNISKEIEANTGIPLEPKTRLQKGARFLTEASRLSPSPGTFRGMNTSLPKPVLGAGVEAAKEILQETGLPEPIAELASFGILKKPPEGSPSIRVGPKKKPSGLTERRYESIKKPTEISPEKITKINQKVENEFKDLADKIIEKSPLNETRTKLRESPAFKQEVAETFQKVEELAGNIKEKFSSQEIKNKLEQNLKQKVESGFTPSEFDKNYSKFINEFIKETPLKESSAQDLVIQYRKNNKSLTEAFEPGQSFAYNRSKRQALSDYNKAIAETIESKYPNSEFSNLFTSSNNEWTKISDAESIDKFLNGLFKGEIKFDKGRQFFNKQGMTLPFERALGKEGFAKFKVLMNDLMTTEQANKLLKKAKNSGYKDLAMNASSYLLHPNVAKAKIGYGILKQGYKTIFEMLLDNPRIAVTWDRGINAMKSGNFNVAQAAFNEVKKAEENLSKSEALRRENLSKFKDKKQIETSE